MSKKSIFLVFFVFIFFISGCSVVFQAGRRSDLDKIKTLEDQLDSLKNAKNVLEEKLFQEIKDKQVRLKMEDKGLVITFVAEVLFDSGKAELRKESFSSLTKVIKILNKEVLSHDIGIEGHTDNEPIKHSGWKSNWELSSQRALSVLHYLQDSGVNPRRLAAIGYGEFRPVASNNTEEGMQLNRRVEIVILPKNLKKLDKAKVSCVKDYGEYK
ncbi:MAG: OmpA family protein [Candidatus Omnitrophota bacterium]|nr:OmpA family protein [Candidatus Omnitrophota bacterium]